MNVVVIAAHGLNCHWLGPYGNEWINTPAFDSIACESVVFDRHFADDPSPIGFANAMPPNLIQSVNDAGISTVFVDDRKRPSAEHPAWQNTIRTRRSDHQPPGEALQLAIQSALQEISRHSSWLLWIETERLMPPWDFEFETYQQYAEESGGFIEERLTEGEEPIDEPSLGPIDLNDDSLRSRLQNSFAAAVTSFDAELAGVIDLFRAAGLDKSATWIFTSGYGCPLGEHGIVGLLGSRLHEELVHLPLIVRLPDGREAMRRVSALTQSTDLGPTILSLLGLPHSGLSLLPLMTGTTTDSRNICRIHAEHGKPIELALRTNTWSYLGARGDEPARLYRKPDDIWEVNDLSFRYADECDQLAAQLNEKEHP